MEESLMRLVKVPLTVTGPENQRMFGVVLGPSGSGKNAIDKEGVQQTQLRSVVS